MKVVWAMPDMGRGSGRGINCKSRADPPKNEAGTGDQERIDQRLRFVNRRSARSFCHIHGDGTSKKVISTMQSRAAMMSLAPRFQDSSGSRVAYHQRQGVPDIQRWAPGLYTEGADPGDVVNQARHISEYF